MKSPIFDKSCTEKSILQKIVDFKNQESYHSVIFLCKHAEKLRMKFVEISVSTKFSSFVIEKRYSTSFRVERDEKQNDGTY